MIITACKSPFLSMKSSSIRPESDFEHNLKWLMFFRLLFTSLLLGSTIILQLNQTPSTLDLPLLFLYGLIAAIFLLSFVYSLIFRRIKKRRLLFAYIQISIDTFFVTIIIFVTGGFSSVFSLLYLVVIIYSSMLLFRKGSIIMAACFAVAFLSSLLSEQA